MLREILSHCAICNNMRHLLRGRKRRCGAVRSSMWPVASLDLLVSIGIRWESMNEERKVSPWVYVAIGCAIPVLLIAVLLGAAMFWGFRVAHDIKDATPEDRAVKAKQVLGCGEIPQGYYAMMTFSIPFVMEMVMLSDRAPDFKDPKSKPFDERGFIYVKSIQGRNGRDLQDVIDGKRDPSEVFRQGNIQLGDLRPIGRGEFKSGDMAVHWSANRGAVTAQGHPLAGLVTLFYVDCPGDEKGRIAVWFGPDPTATSAEAAEPTSFAGLEGTPADEAAIRAFVSPFSLCR